MKRIFSFMFIVCLALTSVMFFACKEKSDHLYIVNGIEIDSVEIERNDATGDFVCEIELENKTKENKIFDFTLIKLKVYDDNTKLLDMINLDKQTINAKADKDFTFILDEEDVNVHGVTIGTSVAVYYDNIKIATVIVEG